MNMLDAHFFLQAGVACGFAIVGFIAGCRWIKLKYVVLRRSTHVAFLTALNQRTRELDQLKCSVHQSRQPKPVKAGHTPKLRLVSAEGEFVDGCPTTDSSLGY